METRQRMAYLSAVRAQVRMVLPELSDALMSAPDLSASRTAAAEPSEAACSKAKFSKERCTRLMAGRQSKDVRGSVQMKKWLLGVQCSLWSLRAMKGWADVRVEEGGGVG